MSRWLRQSTTVTVPLGPALDATDGVTEETALSPTVEISKNNGAFAARNSATAITHDQNGWYRVEFNATDTNTLGNFVAKFDDSATHLPVWHEFQVVPANVFDSYLGTDRLDVNVAEVSDDSIAADNLELDYDGTGLTRANSTIGTATNVTNQVTADVTAISGDAVAANNAELFFDNTGFNASNSTIGTSTNITNLAAGSITSGTIATDAIGADEIAAAGANKIADHTLRRTYANARTSLDGDAVNFRSLLGAVGKLINRVVVAGGTLTVFQEDDVTSTAPGGTQTIKTDATADPITEVDTT